jgi:hypothetical protein
MLNPRSERLQRYEGELVVLLQECDELPIVSFLNLFFLLFLRYIQNITLTNFRYDRKYYKY